MTLNLYTISSDNRRITKTLSTAFVLTGTLRESCSVIDPVITIETSSNISGYNYAYISDFGRYYFITDITAVTDSLWQISMHVDVLMSYKTQLLPLQMVADRQENLINYYLNDSEIPCNAYRNTSTHTFSENLSFRNPLQQTPFILVVAGGEPS